MEKYFCSDSRLLDYLEGTSLFENGEKKCLETKTENKKQEKTKKLKNKKQKTNQQKDEESNFIRMILAHREYFPLANAPPQK